MTEKKDNFEKITHSCKKLCVIFCCKLRIIIAVALKINNNVMYLHLNLYNFVMRGCNSKLSVYNISVIDYH